MRNATMLFDTAGLWLSIGLVLITYICKGGNWDDNLVNWDGKLE